MSNEINTEYIWITSNKAYSAAAPSASSASNPEKINK